MPEPLLMEMTRADYQALPVKPANGTLEHGIAYRNKDGADPAIWVMLPTRLEYQDIALID